MTMPLLQNRDYTLSVAGTMGRNSVVALLGNYMVIGRLKNNTITFRITDFTAEDTIVLICPEGGSITHAQLERGNKASDWTPAPEDAQARIDNTVNSLKNEVIPAIKDGLLNSAEKEAVKQSLNVVSADKKGIDTQYTTIYANTALTGNAKTNLNSAKVALNTAFTNLQNAINDVLGVGEGTRITNTQMTLVTTRLNEYGTALSTYNQRYEQAQDAISTEKKRLGDVYAEAQANLAKIQANAYADGKITAEEQRAIQDAKDRLEEAKRYVDNINVGSTNYLLNSAVPNITGTNAAGITKTMNSEGKLQITAAAGNGNYLSDMGLLASATNVQANIASGELVTFSIEVKSPNSTKAPNFYFGPGMGYYPMSGTVSTTYSKIFVTKPWTATGWSPHLGFQDVVGTYVFRNAKLEKGNKPTDWSPSPEDLTDKISFQAVKSDVNMFTKVMGSTEENVRTNIAKITMTDSLYQTEVQKIHDNTSILSRMGDGVHVLSDFEFDKGYNGVTVYDNARTGKVTVVRETNVTGSSQPNGKRNRLKITHVGGGTTPGWGGIFSGADARINAEFVVKFNASLPTGREFYHANNSIGTGGSITWITDRKGEGVFRDYIYHIKCGSSGSFSNFGHLYVTGGATPSTTSPLIWYLASYDIIDISNSNALNISTKVTQLSDSWALTLKSGNDIKTQINATTDGIRLFGKNIQLDGNVTMTSSFSVPNANIGNLSANKITSGTIDAARIDAKKIVANGLVADQITASHIKADTAFFDMITANTTLTNRLAAKTAWIGTASIADAAITNAKIENLAVTNIKIANQAITNTKIANATIGTAQIGTIDASNGKIVNIDAQYITANHAQLVSAGFKGLNSNMRIDGGAIRINNNDGDFATMNAIPEFRSQDSIGTSAILGKGRSQYYSNNQSRFYIGSSLNGDEVNGKVVHGVHISKGQTWGIYRQSDAFGGTPAQYFKTPAGWGPVNVVEELMRTGKVVNDFSQASALIRKLNGWGSSWPVLQPGDMVMYKAAVPGNSSGIERIWTMGTSSNGSTRTYSHVHHTFEGGTSGVSDARLKHDIKPTNIKALDHIADLSFKQFKWNRNDVLEPLGLIAQESGILRVPDEEQEGIDIQRAMMLALKGIQELSQKVQKLEEQLK